jgi:hypothetical protein
MQTTGVRHIIIVSIISKSEKMVQTCGLLYGDLFSIPVLALITVWTVQILQNFLPLYLATVCQVTPVIGSQGIFAIYASLLPPQIVDSSALSLFPQSFPISFLVFLFLFFLPPTRSIFA